MNYKIREFSYSIAGNINSDFPTVSANATVMCEEAGVNRALVRFKIEFSNGHVYIELQDKTSKIFDYGHEENKRIALKIKDDAHTILIEELRKKAVEVICSHTETVAFRVEL